MQKLQEQPPGFMTQHFMQEMRLDEDSFYSPDREFDILHCSRSYRSYLCENPDATIQQKVGAFVTSRRLMYRLAMVDQTAHEDFRPLPLEMPPSYGQCVPLNGELLEELHGEYPDENFTLNSGRVLLQNPANTTLDVVMPAHVWINWHGGYLAEDVAIDITADQSGILPPVVMDHHDNLAKNGVVYHSYRAFSHRKALIEKFKEREPEIERRLTYFSVALNGLYRVAVGHYLSQHASLSSLAPTHQNITPSSSQYNL